MEQLKCKNCGRVLPEGYKYKYCENCRNVQADAAKKGIAAILGTALSLVIGFVTHGKISKK
jgi:RNA polymerase subunit RPABC4/transcription elongation factor Spt4